ncbi:pheromone receptor [Athelia psychrophila]|uniref:Pheromone receptor n=1 Tax=Athelia psychrophila TaxID=1759441 RepID=A0A166R381_9AGAM|nr:pheromone receptor [Fibularhizoctonia sp. CBS 109695]
MSDPSQTVFSVSAFLGFVMVLLPLTWHLHAWNSGTCYYMIWTAIACLNQFINSIIWSGNAANSAPVWCDISTRIMLGAAVGIPAASACIMRRLYSISCLHSVAVTRAEKRRVVIVDTLACVLFPLLFIVIQFFVQSHRYNIYEDIGCYPANTNSIPTYFLSNIWPIIMGVVAIVYCGLSILAFLHRQSQFDEFLSSNGSLTRSRYFRLMAMGMTAILCTTSLGIFVIWLSATTEPIMPWRGLADAHHDFSRVEQIPAVEWRQDRLVSVYLEWTRWAVPFCALVFFAFFGFAEEARRQYRKAIWTLARRFGFLRSDADSSEKSSS